MPRTKVKVTVTEKGPGFAKLIAELAGAAVTIGVQGKEATETHPNSDLSIGELAAVHELGLGVPERSFIRSWFDENEHRVQEQTRAALAQVAAGRISRKKAMEQLGYEWVKEIRQNIADGRIKPALSESTKKRKGHGTPLLESGTLMNAITFKLFLKQIKSLGKEDRELLRGSK